MRYRYIAEENLGKFLIFSPLNKFKLYTRTVYTVRCLYSIHINRTPIEPRFYLRSLCRTF